jgi:hypothetical protein
MVRSRVLSGSIENDGNYGAVAFTVDDQYFMSVNFSNQTQMHQNHGYRLLFPRSI